MVKTKVKNITKLLITIMCITAMLVSCITISQPKAQVLHAYEPGSSAELASYGYEEWYDPYEDGNGYYIYASVDWSDQLYYQNENGNLTHIYREQVKKIIVTNNASKAPINTDAWVNKVGYTDESLYNNSWDMYIDDSLVCYVVKNQQDSNFYDLIIYGDVETIIGGILGHGEGSDDGMIQYSYDDTSFDNIEVLNLEASDGNCILEDFKTINKIVLPNKMTNDITLPANASGNSEFYIKGESQDVTYTTATPDMQGKTLIRVGTEDTDIDKMYSNSGSGNEEVPSTGVVLDNLPIILGFASMGLIGYAIIVALKKKVYFVK